MTTPIADRDVQVAITLASLTYMNEDERPEVQHAAIEKQLTHTDLPTAGLWELAWGPVWGPDQLGPNMWYIASGTNAAGGKSFALVIRGTKMNSIDGIRQDAELELEPCPFTGPGMPPDVRIAKGFAEAYCNLTHLRIRGTVGESAFQFLGRTLQPGMTLDVVGHSLGGAMAPIVGIACDIAFPEAEVRVFSFGGQSPGNQAFADWFCETFPNQPSRFINDIDIIPMWYADLDEMMQLYGGCPWYIRAAVDSIANRHDYVALANEHRYRGVLYRLPGSQWFPWEIQASKQHEHLYYMQMTGVGIDVIQRRFNAHWTPPAD
jgi:hypothetical protein